MLSSLHVPPFSQEGEHVTDDEKEQEAIDKTYLYIHRLRRICICTHIMLTITKHCLAHMNISFFY